MHSSVALGPRQKIYFPDEKKGPDADLSLLDLGSGSILAERGLFLFGDSIQFRTADFFGIAF